MSDPQADFFGDKAPAKEKRLQDPVELTVTVLREHVKGVLLRNAQDGEGWVSKEHLIWNGTGEQRVKLERWKAKELGFL